MQRYKITVRCLCSTQTSVNGKTIELWSRNKQYTAVTFDFITYNISTNTSKAVLVGPGQEFEDINRKFVPMQFPVYD